jgi:hypothetical protein
MRLPGQLPPPVEKVGLELLGVLGRICKAQPCGDAAKLLVVINQLLNRVPLAVAGPVEGAGAMFIRLLREHGAWRKPPPTWSITFPG